MNEKRKKEMGRKQKMSSLGFPHQIGKKKRIKERKGIMAAPRYGGGVKFL